MPKIEIENVKTPKTRSMHATANKAIQEMALNAVEIAPMELGVNESYIIRFPEIGDVQIEKFKYVGEIAFIPYITEKGGYSVCALVDNSNIAVSTAWGKLIRGKETKVVFARNFNLAISKLAEKSDETANLKRQLKEAQALLAKLTKATTKA